MPALAYNSPIGPLTIHEEDGMIVAVDWGWPPETKETPVLLEACRQLDEYFDGKRKDFDLPLAPTGSSFQRKVWAALERIPFGSTVSYGSLAAELGTAARALGGACGRNPLPIFIPCHRVLAADRSLCGYSGMEGLDTKRFLLKLEGALSD